MPVAGEIPARINRLLLGIILPVRGPIMKISGLSGDNDSVSFVVSFHSIFAATPIPPRYFLAVASSIVSSSIFPVVKSTRTILLL